VAPAIPAVSVARRAKAVVEGHHAVTKEKVRPVRRASSVRTVNPERKVATDLPAKCSFNRTCEEMP